MRSALYAWPAIAAAAMTSALALAGQEAAKAPEKPRQPALRAELLRRVEEDQAARNAFVAWLRGRKAGEQQQTSPEARKIAARMTRVDAGNTKWLKGVIRRWGWPGKSLVGTDGAHAAWLLVQHADRDRPFQKQCLALVEQAAAQGEASKSDLAYLTDRVLAGEGKPQKYGTQLTERDGQLVLSPVEDEASLDKRRAEAGLQPVAEYLEQARSVYGYGAKGR